ncbi:MAG TPA: hypothetical protein VMV49_05235 [Candidatus Deferrimicrobium sp.]|nr:hypothetical protein [Candidatus Deferrimicrobium sp.]
MVDVTLKLNEDWYYLASDTFRPVGNKRHFSPGEILYNTRQNEFFLTVPKKKLKRISEFHAGKKIYEQTGDSQQGRLRKVSKEKSIFAFKLNKDEEVQTCLKLKTLPSNQRIAIEAPRNYPNQEINNPYINYYTKPDAERRAKALFYRIIRNHWRFQVQDQFLLIHSVNGKIYKICLRTGYVFTANNLPRCVTVFSYHYLLPHFDKILAKALTIAYSPQRISTLK